MNPTVASLYLSHLGSAKDVKNKLNSTIGPLLYLDILGEQRPLLMLPTMDEQIPPADLWERRWFFLSNYFAMMVLTLAAMELLRFAAKTISHPRHTKHKFGEHVANYDELRQRMLEGARELGEDSLEDTGSNKKLNRLPETIAQIIYGVAFSTYYVILFVFLYVLIDVAVYGGLMNIDTGMAWEIWSLALELEMIVHICTFLVKTVWTWGSVQEHPTILAVPSFLPLVGNWIHIMKDHLAQGLCFAAAHCSTGTLANVGVILGYLSIVSTIYPLMFLLAMPETREGLRAAHWPITESGVESFKPEGVKTAEPHFLSMAFLKKKTTDALISYCTEEKRVRAVHGEIPHTCLHVLFSFFFGGSLFMTFAIVLSLMKITSIPLIRNMILPWMVKDWHCSKGACRKYLINVGAMDEGAAGAIYDIAKKYHYYDLTYEFFGEYGFFDTQGDLIFFERDPSGTTHLLANGESWGEISNVKVNGLDIQFRGPGSRILGTSEAPSYEVVRYVQLIFSK